MANPSLTIPVNPDIGSQAQAIFNDMGLDIVTVIDCFLRQAIQDKGSVVAFIGDNLNTPINSFSEPTNSPNKRMEILRSLIGSIDDTTFVEPLEVETPDAPRNWELMDT
jgi:hypothetical protein